MSKTDLLVCNCQKTMELDGAKLADALGLAEPLPVFTELCRSQCASFENALKGEGSLRVACTEQAPLFAEIAEQHGASGRVTFTNIRERAGWSADKADKTPKMAALLAEAAYVATPTGLTTLKSEGVCLVIGAGQAALDAAGKLANRLAVTLLLTSPDDAVAPKAAAFAIHSGKIKSASGHLGAFEVVVDQFADLVPSSRGALDFTMPRDGFRSKCDLIVDISGGTPLFPATARRDGYLRADVGNPVAVAEALFAATDLVGEFEKPLYVRYDADICAHARSEKVGCRNCLDLCPTGAISTNGDHVAIDAAVCGGCGSCSAACPTGAVDYAYPSRNDLLARFQILTAAYAAAGGQRPVLLFHDFGDGEDLIHAVARFGGGLPARVIPVALHAPFQGGHDIILAAFASGFQHVVCLISPNAAHERPGLDAQVALANAILEGLSIAPPSAPRAHVVETADPDALAATLARLDSADSGQASHELPRQAFATSGGKRDLARLAIAKLRESRIATGATVPEIITLPSAAPYGRINVKVEGCTLCLSCVSACPAGAISDNPDRPQISFTEAACVQCGLCVATCPERVIALEPRLNLAATALSPNVVKHEEPFACISCGKPFGSKSTIDAVTAKLEGHAMFQSGDQLRLIQMCDDCRVVTVAQSDDNPFAMGDRPKVRTTDDYLSDDPAPETGRGNRRKPDDFLS